MDDAHVDNNYVDLRGLVDKGEERSILKHVVPLSYGEPVHKPEHHVPAAHVQVHVEQPKGLSRRRFIGYAAMIGVGTVFGGTAWYQHHEQERQFLVRALAKTKQDLNQQFLIPLHQEGGIPYGYFRKQEYLFVHGGDGLSEVYPQGLLILHERTQDDDLLKLIPRFLEQIRLSTVPLQDPDSMRRADVNNAALGRMQIGERVKQYVEQHGLAGKFYTYEQDVIEQRAQDARTAQLLAPRLYQQHAHAFFGMLPDKRDCIVKADQAYFLFPLLSAGVRNGIGPMLDPGSAIKRPRNEVEELLAQQEPMTITEFYDMVLDSSTMFVNALTFPDGRSVYQARLDDDRNVIWRNPRNSDDQGYKTRGATDPATVTRDHVLLLDGLLHARRLMGELQSVAHPTYALKFEIVGSMLEDRCKRMTKLLQAGLETELSDIKARGALPVHLYLPEGNSIEFEKPDVASTAHAATLFARQHHSTAALRRTLFGLAEENLEKTLREEDPIAGILPPKSRGYHPAWVDGWMALGDWKLLEL